MKSKQLALIMLGLLMVPLSGMRRTAPPGDIFGAVKNGDAATVKTLLDGDPSLVGARDADGRTPLHWAARAATPNLEIVTLLLDRGAGVNAPDNNGIVPLHSAASRGQAEAAALLLARGADPNIRDKARNTPLAMAVINLPFGYAVPQGRKDVVEALVEAGAEFPLAGEDGRKLWHRALAGSYARLASKMMAGGIDPKTRNNDDGTSLHSAAAGGSEALLEPLVKAGLDIDGLNRYGSTPLQIAARLGRAGTVRRLLALGARLDARSPAGMTAYNYAVEAGFGEVVDLLAAQGADRSDPSFPRREGPYLGQRPPGDEPELFAPGVLSTESMEHGPAVFSPGGLAVYWTRAGGDGGGRIMSMKLEDGRWTPPRSLDLSGRLNEEMPGLSPDGQRLFFDVEDPDRARRYGLWQADREGTGWGGARPLGPAVNSGGENSQPSISSDGTLYFSSGRDGGQGGFDLYRSRFEGGRYLPPENLGPGINTDSTEIHPFVAPDESFLMFSSDRPGGKGSFDLYIAFRAPDGRFGPALNMGDRINGAGTVNWLGAVSPDGKYLFFASNRNGNSLDIWWVDARFIEDLRPRAKA